MIYNLQDINTAIKAGKTVHWQNTAYTVKPSGNREGAYLICHFNGFCTTLNPETEYFAHFFFMAEIEYVANDEDAQANVLTIEGCRSTDIHQRLATLQEKGINAVCHDLELFTDKQKKEWTVTLKIVTTTTEFKTILADSLEEATEKAVNLFAEWEDGEITRKTYVENVEETKPHLRIVQDHK